MNPAANGPRSAGAEGPELICTTALCDSAAVAFVSWRTQPQALPFCRRCADRLASHGDTVVPLTAGPLTHRVA